MPDTMDLQSDQFMTLLTDALRAGPGSPEWSQAVKVLRASDQNVDEYTLLYAAREHLESGKEYRSVRAGAGFTRKVMDAVEQEGRPRGPSTANVIALIAAALILSVVVVVGVMLLKNGGNNGTPPSHGLDELQSTIFGNKVDEASFTGKDATAPGNGFAAFGKLPLAVKGGELRPSTQPAGEPSAYVPGGWVTADGVPANQPTEVNATVKVGKAADDGVVQVFVSEDPVTDANAAGGRELVWQLRGGESRVFLAADPSADAGKAEKVGGGQHELNVRVVLNKDLAIVDAGGKRLYAGPHHLSADKPRYVGVRFIRKGGEKWDQVGVTSLVVLKP